MKAIHNEKEFLDAFKIGDQFWTLEVISGKPIGYQGDKDPEAQREYI